MFDEDSVEAHSTIPAQRRRVRATAASPASPPLSLDEAMNFVAQHRIILCYDHRGVAAWSPGKPLPLNLHRAIRRERTRLAEALRAGDVRLCPIGNHRQFWYYIGDGRFRCEKCQELEPFIDLTSA